MDHEDLPNRRVRVDGEGQQRVGRTSHLDVALTLLPAWPNCRSRARLRRRTFTRGSPRKPKVRGSVSAVTRLRTRSGAIPRAPANRGPCHSAASGARCGSSPEPEAVSSSAGMAPSAAGFARDNASASFATRSRSFLEVGPKLDPDDEVASKPLSPAADGRGWKYSGRANAWAKSSEPTMRPPSAFSKLPLDALAKRTRPIAETTNG